VAEKIQVVIIDDHPLFRQGLRQVIESDPRFELVAEAGDGEKGFQLILTTKPHVAILDINLPAASGLEIARRIKAKRLRTQIVILTMYKEEETFNRAMSLGVKGFVTKENAVEDILSSIITVAEGGYYLSPSISSYLVNRRNRSDQLATKKPGLEDLTTAERRVLKLVAEKKTSRQIGAELFISPRTVEAHRANICEKLELRGSHSLVHFALENRALL
jgi:DNA-binding NarL/FixJ family response regulator